jgi:ribA/ribD-fused uncharacterized protein
MAIAAFSGKYRFLSNFWQLREGYGVHIPQNVPHTLNAAERGLLLPTTEHAFVVSKTLNASERFRALHSCGGTCGKAACTTAGQVKREGKTLTLRPDWEQICRTVMKTVVREKFNDPELAKLLLATGSEELIEGNHWHDRRWGRCTCPQHKGEGTNWLGQILMDVREQLNAADLKRPEVNTNPPCIYCGETLQFHGRFARCEGGATQFTAGV